MSECLFAAQKAIGIAETFEPRGPAHPGAPVRAPFGRPYEAAVGRVTQWCVIWIGHGVTFR
jgi:hypothetical protein